MPAANGPLEGAQLFYLDERYGHPDEFGGSRGQPHVLGRDDRCLQSATRPRISAAPVCPCREAIGRSGRRSHLGATPQQHDTASGSSRRGVAESRPLRDLSSANRRSNESAFAFHNNALELKTIHQLAGRPISRHVGQKRTVPLPRDIGGYCRRGTKKHPPEKNIITLQRIDRRVFEGDKFSLLSMA